MNSTVTTTLHRSLYFRLVLVVAAGVALASIDAQAEQKNKAGQGKPAAKNAAAKKKAGNAKSKGSGDAGKKSTSKKNNAHKSTAKKGEGQNAGAKKGDGKNSHAKNGQGKKNSPKKLGRHVDTNDVVRADIRQWMLANNPGLKANFLKMERPATKVKLPNGQTVPIYRLKQFLDVNFHLHFHAAQKSGMKIVSEMEDKTRRLMARPEFRQWLLEYQPVYRIHQQGKGSGQEMYEWFRHQLHRDVAVHAGKKYHLPVGGGGGIGAPSWATWKAMNIFWHEAMLAIDAGSDNKKRTLNRPLSSALAGQMKKWDKQKKWKYETIDLNKLTIPKT